MTICSFAAAESAYVPAVRRHIASQQESAGVTGGPHRCSTRPTPAKAPHRAGGHPGDRLATPRRSDDRFWHVKQTPFILLTVG